MASQQEKTTAQLLRRRWSSEKIHQYVGQFNKSWFAYASDESIREKAASGGVVTALLSDLLYQKQVDGVLACRSRVTDGNVFPEFYIARDKKALLASQGSKYMQVDFASDALPKLRSFEGRLAVVILPCDTSTLRRAMAKDGLLAEKINLIITLFCGHNSSSELTDMVVGKLAPGDAKLIEFRHRQGHWRGKLQAKFDDGSVIEKPFSFFSDYQNLYFFCQQKCHHCHDHTGYESDISVGDIWSLRMKDNPIKHSAVITRSPRGKAVFSDAVESGALIAHEEPIEEICEGQARTMPFHYNVSARAKVGSLMGIKIKDSVYTRVRWNDFIVAWMVLFNEKLSSSRTGKKMISRTPRFVLKFMLYLMKGLESI